MNNTEQIISKMQASFPHRYNVYDKNTILYTLLSVFGERYNVRTNIIDRLYAMIGIDSTYDEDLEHRWGSLLGVYRQNGESFDNYRSRLLIIYSSLAGGTAEAIKYAIASAIGIVTDADTIDKYIKIYDAWEYPYEVNDTINKTYGHVICTVDMQMDDSVLTMHDNIMEAINTTKASGIYPYLLFLYTTSETATISHDDEYLNDVFINRAYDEQHMIVTSDNHNDRIIYSSFNEYGDIDSINLMKWSSMGTNTHNAVLNDGFVTNMLMKTDEYDDAIYNAPVLGSSAILGSAVLGLKLDK